MTTRVTWRRVPRSFLCSASGCFFGAGAGAGAGVVGDLLLCCLLLLYALFALLSLVVLWPCCWRLAYIAVFSLCCDCEELNLFLLVLV